MTDNEIIKTINSIEFHLKAAISELEKMKSAFQTESKVVKKPKNNNFLEHLIKSGKIKKE